MVPTTTSLGEELLLSTRQTGHATPMPAMRPGTYRLPRLSPVIPSIRSGVVTRVENVGLFGKGPPLSAARAGFPVRGETSSDKANRLRAIFMCSSFELETRCGIFLPALQHLLQLLLRHRDVHPGALRLEQHEGTRVALGPAAV